VIHPAKPDAWLPAVWTSPDGKTWTLVVLPATLPQHPFGSFAFGRGVYMGIIGDTVWRSTNLTNWNRVLALPSGSADGREPVVRSYGTDFVAAVTGPKGDSFAYRSVLGGSWQRADLGGPIENLVGTSSGFAAVMAQPDGSMLAMGSINGSTWWQLSDLPIANGQCNLDMLLCYGPAGILDGFAYSSDGVNWQSVPWAAGLPGSLAYGPSPDPMFVTMFSGGNGGPAAVYVIQPGP
jgi:hypothetical protein